MGNKNGFEVVRSELANPSAGLTDEQTQVLSSLATALLQAGFTFEHIIDRLDPGIMEMEVRDGFRNGF